MQGEVFEGELAVAAEQEGEESKQVEQEKDHRAGIVSGSEPTDQPLAAGRGFGEGHLSARTNVEASCQEHVTPLPFVAYHSKLELDSRGFIESAHAAGSN